ncbi:ABC transporter permease [Tepidiphilus margaritifer]|uniref:ABC transporter permease n=1 Tax=Tepidiphilus margaritifer TaxID=203471 RepID=UPI000412DF63|nr:ABC transporter permease [Tepidiphilus margaritifer]
MRTWARLLLPLAGFAAAALLWEAAILALGARVPIAAQFAPTMALRTLARLCGEALWWHHLAMSVQRVLVGLVLAALVGVPLGLLVGLSRSFARATGPLFQFLRMISPLSWMPVAVMLLGVGDAPVYFLLAFAAVWPVLLNTAAGVAQLERGWLLLAKSLAATPFETLTRIILPGILPQLLTGLRLAIGVSWIVLVPAEMLGVDAGLGYFILDARDRLAYHELMAAILAVGALGALLDTAAQHLRVNGRQN